MAAKNKISYSLSDFLKGSALDSLDQAVFVVDKNFIVLAGNVSFRTLLALENNWVGRSLWELASFQKEAEVKKKLQEIIQGTSPPEILELSCYRPAGLFLKARTIPIKDKTGQRNKFVLFILEDISREKKQAQEIIERNEETKKLILIAFHDLKASIVAIQGLLESFRHENEMVLNERAKFYLDSIRNRLFFTERLARDVVDFTRIGMYIFPTEKVNINEILISLEHELGQRLKEKKIKLKIPTELPVIYASRERFSRVFYNLLDNAIKYSRPDIENPQILVGYLRKDDRIIFFVRDNGIGISKNNQTNIFDLFERLPRAIQQHPEGTGIGLAIVKKIIEMYRGEVWVESEENQGAAFYFSLPSEMLY